MLMDMGLDLYRPLWTKTKGQSDTQEKEKERKWVKQIIMDAAREIHKRKGNNENRNPGDIREVELR